MATPLIIGTAEREKLAALRIRAVAEPLDMPAVIAELKQPGGMETHIERMKRLTVRLNGPVRWEVTFSVELGHPVGAARHLSVSVKRRGRKPNVAALWMVAEELGFVGGLSACRVWEEPLDAGRAALNALQPIAVTVASAQQ